MTDVAFSPQASADLLAAYAFGVETFGSESALDYHRGLQAAIDRLSTFPQIGPVYHGLRPPIRFLTYRRHHILYDFDGTRVWIIRILHHAQDVRSLF